MKTFFIVILILVAGILVTSFNLSTDQDRINTFAQKHAMSVVEIDHHMWIWGPFFTDNDGRVYKVTLTDTTSKQRIFWFRLGTLFMDGTYEEVNDNYVEVELE